MGGTSIARSLRLSLLAATVSVATVAVLASAWVANRETKAELVRAVNDDLERANEIAVRFQLRAADFAEAGGNPWSDETGTGGLDEFVAGLATESGLRVIVRSNEDGSVLADSEGLDGRDRPPGASRTIGPPPESAEAELDRVQNYWNALSECFKKQNIPFETATENGVTKPVIRNGTSLGSKRQAVDDCRNGLSDRLEYVPPFPAVDVFIGQPDIAARVTDVDGLTRRLAATIVGVLLLAIVATALLARKILRPIGILTSAAQVMGRGDLSHRVRLRRGDEIGQLADTFDAMAASLEQSAHQRKRMTSDVAHELRTPLSNIRGYLEAAQDGVAELSPALVSSLLEDTLLLQGLVEDLQELSVAESGQLQLQKSLTDIDELATSVAAAHRARALQGGIAIQTDAASGAQLSLDVRRIRQVVTNLVENAIRHTDAGGEIRVTTRRLEGAVEVAVTDTGTGIEPEHLPHLFERFYRADASRNRATGGSGLGLAITRELVAAHGGAISVTSTVGVGSRFAVVLPLDDGSPAGANRLNNGTSVYLSRG